MLFGQRGEIDRNRHAACGMALKSSAARVRGMMGKGDCRYCEILCGMGVSADVVRSVQPDRSQSACGMARKSMPAAQSEATVVSSGDSNIATGEITGSASGTRAP